MKKKERRKKNGFAKSMYLSVKIINKWEEKSGDNIIHSIVCTIIFTRKD